ncbi:uncharacterized protein isoform X3 [Notothenia coriiceps]|uniref:Uncharacterized protein LOC104960208 isoform X2 n=1 Tax=Notothenia coriiceps TaxID=8208 RepID=A0A6I9PHL7_9TELE|nr:PREDICTED: uncharacterized protein LOC104960208 isoform X2 [Notothenia coriiceps]XP_010786488.1 PREDICTED: uncharacterized protein LOC104960208 isoform X3 [Notothenia coriiceps]
MMGTADELLDLMFKWMDQKEGCAKQLRKLARELEDLREKCNRNQFIGNSAQVAGAASLVGAGLITLITGGLAVTFLALGATYMGVGVTISVVTHLNEHLLSSVTMEKAQRIESKSNKIAERIKRLFEQLRKECKAESVNADKDELDQRVMAKVLGAIGRRNGQKWTVCDSIKLSSSSGPQFPLNEILLNGVLPAKAVAGVAHILEAFALPARGKYPKLPPVDEASKQIFKIMFTISKVVGTALRGTALRDTALRGAALKEGVAALKEGVTALIERGTALKERGTALKEGGTALKGGGNDLKGRAMIAVGVVGVAGLAVALPKAIDSWKKMIENNHVTEASQSIRGAADDLDNMSRTLRNQFKGIKTMMANSQREHEERLKKEWFQRALQEHGNLKMAGMALGSLFLFLFLFQGAIFCKTEKDMSLSSAEGSIQGKETEFHMGLRHEEERQGHQTEWTGSDQEKGSECTGSEQEKGSEWRDESFKRKLI